MQITDPKSHSLHNYHLKINCTDQIISVLEYLPVESSLTSGVDKLLQSPPVTRSVLTADSKEELTGFKGISFLVLLHMFTHNIKHGAAANQQVALPMTFPILSFLCYYSLRQLWVSLVVYCGRKQVQDSSNKFLIPYVILEGKKQPQHISLWPALLSTCCLLLLYKLLTIN